MSPRHAVGVVTSDWAQQQIVMGKGARRWSSREFRLEVHKVAGEISNAAGRTATDRPAVDLAARINEKSRQKLENIIGKPKILTLAVVVGYNVTTETVGGVA